MDNRIKVGVRIRPMSSKEVTEGAASTVSADQGRILTNQADAKKSGSNFNFDWTFDSNAGQRVIYDDMCKPLIDKVFEGYNATFFACERPPPLSPLLHELTPCRWSNRRRQDIYDGHHL